VATVSPQYDLVQHHEVFGWLAEGLKTTEEQPDALSGTLTLSKYGERMLEHGHWKPRRHILRDLRQLQKWSVDAHPVLPSGIVLQKSLCFDILLNVKQA
jgi:hypothetical protein